MVMGQLKSLNGVKRLSCQKGPMGVGRMELRDLASRKALGVAYLWRQNEVKGLALC